jgi:hypothetical protein
MDNVIREKTRPSYIFHWPDAGEKKKTGARKTNKQFFNSKNSYMLKIDSREKAKKRAWAKRSMREKVS